MIGKFSLSISLLVNLNCCKIILMDKSGSSAVAPLIINRKGFENGKEVSSRKGTRRSVSLLVNWCKICISCHWPGNGHHSDNNQSGKKAECRGDECHYLCHQIIMCVSHPPEVTSPDGGLCLVASLWSALCWILVTVWCAPSVHSPGAAAQVINTL